MTNNHDFKPGAIITLMEQINDSFEILWIEENMKFYNNLAIKCLEYKYTWITLLDSKAEDVQRKVSQAIWAIFAISNRIIDRSDEWVMDMNRKVREISAVLWYPPMLYADENLWKASLEEAHIQRNNKQKNFDQSIDLISRWFWELLTQSTLKRREFWEQSTKKGDNIFTLDGEVHQTRWANSKVTHCSELLEIDGEVYWKFTFWYRNSDRKHIRLVTEWWQASNWFRYDKWHELTLEDQRKIIHTI